MTGPLPTGRATSGTTSPPAGASRAHAQPGGPLLVPAPGERDGAHRLPLPPPGHPVTDGRRPAGQRRRTVLADGGRRLRLVGLEPGPPQQRHHRRLPAGAGGGAGMAADHAQRVRPRDGTAHVGRRDQPGRQRPAQARRARRRGPRGQRRAHQPGRSARGRPALRDRGRAARPARPAAVRDPAALRRPPEHPGPHVGHLGLGAGLAQRAVPPERDVDAPHRVRRRPRRPPCRSRSSTR